MIVMGTGHRLQDMPCKFDKKHPFKIEKLKLICKYLDEHRGDIEYVISGMAQGYDQWLAWSCIQTNTIIHAYVPFKGQERLWQKDHQEQYFKLLDKCNEIKYINDEGYASWKMHTRNDAMLKDSNCVLCLWNPDKKFGGTYSTVNKAFKLNKTIINLWHKDAHIISEI